MPDEFGLKFNSAIRQFGGLSREQQGEILTFLRAP